VFWPKNLVFSKQFSNPDTIRRFDRDVMDRRTARQTELSQHVGLSLLRLEFRQKATRT